MEPDPPKPLPSVVSPEQVQQSLRGLLRLVAREVVRRRKAAQSSPAESERSTGHGASLLNRGHGAKLPN
jgi:hypothetical protein